MKSAFIGLLFLMCITVLSFGHYHWNKNIAEAGKDNKVYNQQLKAEENVKIEAAKKTWLGKTEPRVFVIGSSVAAGAGASDVTKTSWAGLLNQSFIKTNPDLYFSNLGVGGYTTKDILDNKILDKVLDPDVVVFETCLLNNFSKYTISESVSQIDQIYNILHQKYPNVRIVFMPSEPPVTVDRRIDKEGHSYRQYVSIIGDHIKTQGWDYIDFWDAYENGVSNTGQTLKSVLVDDVHPNDTGYKIWFDSIKGYFGITD